MKRVLLCAILASGFSGFINAQNTEDTLLTLAAVFSDHMVLQRYKPIVIYGKVKAGGQVKVSFLNKTRVTNADDSGHWKAAFPGLKRGGPFEISVSGGGQHIILKDVLIGDVWICSGQSNMEFQLKDSQTGPEELKQADFTSKIRLLKLGGIVSTSPISWDSTTFSKINQFEFFSGSWKILSASSAESFSAVAYYFGKKLVKEKNVPIGLIQVALGGSPAESWIDRRELEEDGRFEDMLKNWQNSQDVMEWCRERAAVNLASRNSVAQKHPYQPGYNFQAGIAPLTAFPVAGVIWYQGESNVHNVLLHARLFPMLVNNWRQKWGYQLPFYYVQLSGIDRPFWPEFRDSQRQMQKTLPHSGMAVSYDLGDSLNVHPIRKKEIGHRLAILALKGTYHKNIVANGPIPQSAYAHEGEIMLEFASAKKLLTPGNGALTGFEIINQEGMRTPAVAIIRKNKVRITIPGGEKITTVLYGYQPFTRANLYNEAALPAATFSIDVR